jgi:ATP-dependent helicase HepA
MRAMLASSQIVPGQRWVSEAEPELGLGIVRGCGQGRIELEFPAAAEHRLFALASAPLRRVRLSPGETLETRAGGRLRVESAREEGGLVTYLAEGREVPEGELADTLRFNKPEERLFAGLVDSLAHYRLRIEALAQRAALRRSSARGLLGARIDLLPHQIATVEAIADRAQPRVLLADEVGLGKTIEACLIVHRLLLTGRAGRVLVIVPESLVHQWFIELLRRFHLSFSLFDAERFASLRAGDPSANPFLDSQWVLASERFLLSDEAVGQALVEAPWDVLVVDEAHHLEWSPEGASPAYRLVEELAGRTPAVLLLTATPEQLGMAGHFARLRLLDPDRYDELETFLREAEGYQAVADLVEAVEAWPHPRMERSEFARLAERAGTDSRLLEWWTGDEARPVDALVSRLIDAFGPGRVLFRSTRAGLGGFPPREAILHPLRSEDGPFAVKVRWLASLLRELPEEKLLVITHTRPEAERIVEALQALLRVETALFHEGMTLLQRDRQAAYFADPEGARLLVCSEIGSEGRNFQFAHHLVLFDLPGDPELVEQRIGRLDRIGQAETIRLHLPFRAGTREEAWVRWYHEGLDAFEHCLPGGHGFGALFAERLEGLVDPLEPIEVERVVADARSRCAAFRAKLSSGRDRLLGLHPEGRRRAEQLIARIEKAGQPRVCEEFAVRLFDGCGLVVEELAPRRYRLAPGLLTAEAFPGLPESGLVGTFDRREAVAREDLVFLSADHPLLAAAFDIWLGTDSGNAGFALWPGAGREGIFLELWCVVEVVAPRRLPIDRFLPPTPVRVVVDHQGQALESAGAWHEGDLVPGDAAPLLGRGVVRRKLLPAMVEAAQALGAKAVGRVVAAARREATAWYDDERERLELLARLNDHVRPSELTRLAEERAAVLAALETAAARSDALRLVWAQS